MYAVASDNMGRTRNVPSSGPVWDSAVQPCQGRKMEHWLLNNFNKVSQARGHGGLGYLRNIVQVLYGVEAGGDVERVMRLPSIPTLEDAFPDIPERRVLPSLNTPTIDMRAQDEYTRARGTDPEAVGV